MLAQAVIRAREAAERLTVEGRRIRRVRVVKQAASAEMV